MFNLPLYSIHTNILTFSGILARHMRLVCGKRMPGFLRNLYNVENEKVEPHLHARVPSYCASVDIVRIGFRAIRSCKERKIWVVPYRILREKYINCYFPEEVLLLA